jgi:tetratricopeptide (TPR) repeat protein
MALIGRRREIAEVERLLDSAAAGSGGVLVVAGPAGSGRTTLATEAVRAARQRGFDVHRAAAVAGRPGRWVWAQLLRDAGAPGELVTGLLADPGPLDLDSAAAALCAGPRRLLAIDDADRGGPQTAELVALLAGRAATGQTAVLVTAAVPLGVARELWLGPLSPAELGKLTGERRPEVRQALWAAARGMPGPARPLAAALAALPPDGDPVVQLALLAESAEGFLDIDAGLVRLLETALHRVAGQDARARLLARLARALLGDAASAGRRRELVADALALARHSDNPAVLAEVLDARLYALWDPAGAADRLTAAAEIAELAGASADLELERRGLFWRFVALMELGRVSEAESALAAFEREARAAGDAAGLMMVTARHAMLATVRGRFADAHALIGQAAEQGRQAALPDTGRLVGTLHGAVALTRGDPSGLEFAVAELRAFARRVPGHFHDATVARVLLAAGQPEEAGLELQRALPRVLPGSGPRWLGAAADLAAVAAGTGNADAAARLYDALAGYRGRLVVWAGANSVTGPVTHYLGILAAQLGRLDEAAEHLERAAAMQRGIGALPWLAWTLAALAGVLRRRGRGGDAESAAGHRRQAGAIARQLGMPGLLAALSVPADSVPADERALRRDGQDWLLTAGAERARLRDSRGLHYLRALLAAPGSEIAALDLVAGGAGLRGTAPEPVLDAAARAAYRRRLTELAAELAAADRGGDAARAGRAEREREAVLDELSRAAGLGGRARRVSAEDERARVNVTRTLRAALDRITAAAPSAGAHLAASVRTGRACRYQPAPGGPARWRV